jgi:hypothetical protein
MLTFHDFDFGYTRLYCSSNVLDSSVTEKDIDHGGD